MFTHRGQRFEQVECLETLLLMLVNFGNDQIKASNLRQQYIS